MTEKELAMEYLRRDRVLNISMLEPLRLGRAQVLARSGRGVVLQMDDVTMVAAETAGEARTLLAAAPEFETLNVMGGHLAAQLTECCGLELTSCCWQAVYLREETLPVSGDIRQLGLEYFQEVLDGYQLFHDEAYVRDRLQAGVIYGAFVEDRLAGFVGEHHEGSMGMLEVFPEFRRRGLGLALESFQINRFLSEGRVPFDQVIVGNEKSLGLQRKVGMTVSQDTMSWLKRRI